MSQQPHQIAAVGFSSFEVGAFEAFFKMVAVSRPPGFAITRDLQGAALIFVNASPDMDLHRFMHSEASGRPVIVVGQADASLGVPVLPRPIRLTSALALANQLLAKVAAQNGTNARVALTEEERNPSTISPAFWSMATEPKANPSTHVPSPNPQTQPAHLLSPQQRAQAAIARSVPSQVNTSSQDASTRVSASTGAVPEQLDSRPGQRPTTSRPTGATAQALNQLAAPQARVSVPAATTRAAPQPASRQNTAVNLGLAPEQSYDDILVVDDSDIALKFMQEHLGAFGFRVHLAKSGEECLVMLNQMKFRCVFLDVMMTGIDGYQTCRVIKQRKYPDGGAPKVIMMTSRSGAIDRVRGALAGCDGYLVKPVDEGKLIKALFQNNVANAQQTQVTMRRRFDALSR